MVESCLTSVIQSPELQSKYSQNPLLFWKVHGRVILFSINLLRHSLGCRRVLCLVPDKLHKIYFLHDNLQFILDSCDDIIDE